MKPRRPPTSASVVWSTRHRRQHHAASAGAAATATVAGSPYAIIPSAAVGTGLGNYNISYVNGSLTVDPRPLTITASNKTKVYGDTVVFDETTPSTDF